MIEHLQSLYTRDLQKLADEVSSYPGHDKIWNVPPGVINSGGNLCLHICGNLQHFVGAVLGSTGYVRNREAEFGSRNVPLPSLLQEVETTVRSVNSTLENLSEARLNEKYPIDVFGFEMTTYWFLLHLYGHCNYHLGQLNYHRRIVSKQE